jgi:hypothetical protein
MPDLTPQCELCTNESYYFDDSDVQCRSCGDTGVYAAVFVVLVVTGLVAGGGVLVLARSDALPKQRFTRKPAKLLRRFIKLWTSAGMRNKAKCAVSRPVGCSCRYVTRAGGASLLEYKSTRARRASAGCETAPLPPHPA